MTLKKLHLKAWAPWANVGHTEESGDNGDMFVTCDNVWPTHPRFWLLNLWNCLMVLVWFFFRVTCMEKLIHMRFPPPTLPLISCPCHPCLSISRASMGHLGKVICFRDGIGQCVSIVTQSISSISCHIHGSMCPCIQVMHVYGIIGTSSEFPWCHL